MRAAKEGDLVEVEWTDANSDSSQLKRHELPKLEKVFTYGVLVLITDRAYTIASEMLEASNEAEETSYRGTTVIPRVWDVRVRRLYRKGEQ